MEEDPVELCTRHLEEIGRALAAFQRDHEDLPGHLSDLFPGYVADPAIFHCPADASAGKPLPSWAPGDAKWPISYLYEMSMEPGAPWADRPTASASPWAGPERLRSGVTWREAKRLDQYHFGDRVPVVSCWHHEKGRLFLLPSGQV